MSYARFGWDGSSVYPTLVAKLERLVEESPMSLPSQRSRTFAPDSSWAVARENPKRMAASDEAQATADAIVALIAAGRRRSVTIQWMPDDNGQGCRFEVISAHSGDFLVIAVVDADGSVTLTHDPPGRR